MTATLFATEQPRAVFSPCRRYRYTLWRVWDSGLPLMMVVGLNPSTADDNQDDPTLRRVQAFARANGCGSLVMTNLFAYRATAPADMKAAADPVGPLNDRSLALAAAQAHTIVLAWGKDGSHRGRDREVLALLSGRRLHCLGRNGDCTPKHPLYLPAATALEPFEVGR